MGFRGLVDRLVGVDGGDEQQAAAIPHDLLACVVSFLMPNGGTRRKQSSSRSRKGG